MMLPRQALVVVEGDWISTQMWVRLCYVWREKVRLCLLYGNQVT